MIKRISSKCINNNITYVLIYHENGVNCEVGIFDKIFNNELISSESYTKTWIHDKILKETGIEYNI